MKKKIVSLTMALVMCLSLTVSAFATEENEPLIEDMTIEQNENARINVYNRAWFAALRAPVYTNYGANYTHNAALNQITGYVYGQGHYPDYRVGNDSFAVVGCEIAATYNALRNNGRQISIANIIRSFELNGYLMGAGYLGSDPYAIGEYLDANSVSYTEFPNNSSYTSFKNEVTNNINSRCTYIVSFWNSSSLGDGLHTVAFYSNGGKLYVYNLNSNNTSVTTKSSLTSFVSSDRYITGYALGQRSRILE